MKKQSYTYESFLFFENVCLALGDDKMRELFTTEEPRRTKRFKEWRKEVDCPQLTDYKFAHLMRYYQTRAQTKAAFIKEYSQNQIDKDLLKILDTPAWSS